MEQVYLILHNIQLLNKINKLDIDFEICQVQKVKFMIILFTSEKHDLVHH